MSEITVFISYSHDSETHRDKVLALSERLRLDGISTLLDRYVNGSPLEGWHRWMPNQLDDAQFVLVICTETYYRRFRGHEVPDKGKGADWEGMLITQEIYNSRSTTVKFVPVIFSQTDEKFIPEPMRSSTHYTLTSKAAYQSLYDFLLGQSGVEPQPVGALKTKPRQKGAALNFSEPAISTRPIDISRIIKYAPDELIGRERETKFLSDAWNQVVRGDAERPHVITFVALGGEGKTSLVAKWVAGLLHQGLTGCNGGCFAWSFYSQGSGDKSTVSTELFLSEALKFFGDSETAESVLNACEKGRCLARLAGERRSLLILDGLEPLQYSPVSPMPGGLRDQGVAELLKGLSANSNGLCVVTTRYSIPDLKVYRQTTALEIPLLRLSKEAGVALIQTLGVRKESGSLKDFESLVEEVKGHALTLNLLGTFLRDAHAGDVRRRDIVVLSEADEEEREGHAFRVMDAYVKWFESEGDKGRRALAILGLLGLFDRPMTSDCFWALLKPYSISGLTEALVHLTETQRNMAISRLESAGLITVNRDTGGALVSLDTHPLLRQYFAARVSNRHPDAWREGHRRLYRHLCYATKEGVEPTVEELQPLYQAIAHGCQAGMQCEACDDVFRSRIRQKGKIYSFMNQRSFGCDLGALFWFFETPWTQPLSVFITAEDNHRPWILNEAALSLRALGRLVEALEPLRIGLEIRKQQKAWNNAAVMAYNLSELEQALGRTSEALVSAKCSVTYADLGSREFWRIASRSREADVLHQMGRLFEAETCFQNAEKLLADRHDFYSQLYATASYQYCELLLSASALVAWKITLSPTFRDFPSSLFTRCIDIFGRASRTLTWAKEKRFLLDIALGRLTLGLAALYAAILEGGDCGFPLRRSDKQQQDVVDTLEGVVADLRIAGMQEHLIRGLLARAWLRGLTGLLTGCESTHSDLNEAWEIAERGPMPLLMADIHLYRARLFLREERYPWDKNPNGTTRGPKDDLVEARRLIEKHGYWRRKDELEDAERAIIMAHNRIVE